MRRHLARGRLRGGAARRVTVEPALGLRARRATTAGACVEGRERGELLRVVRDDAGEPVKLYFATYPCTRNPSTFG